MDRLEAIVGKEDAIVFVGSGLSRWSGLPSWEGLIECLAEFLESLGKDASLVRREAADGDLLQAASYGLAKLTQPQVAQFIRAASRSGSAAPAPIHQALMELGPSCFITTNYDDLLEQAFRLWRNDPSEPQIVLNRQLVEQAEIVQTHARNFIFKPHGDARDVDTIIFTREHYRMLKPEGDFSLTLTTLMTLLSSRPILFVGFGLRDPDFLHIRDLLANIYRGGMRDHYAIVADPVPDQIDWWRDAMGVHLVGYETRPGTSSVEIHGALLELLTAARQPSRPAATPARTFDLDDAGLVLALARYAAGNLTGGTESRFPIRVWRARDHGPRLGRIDRYHNWTIERLLGDGPGRIVLVGAPGAGKTFAIRHAVETLATALQDACLQGRLTNATKVPVLIDLKLYDGDLARQIENRFPPKIGLALLSGAFPVKLFLDAYNEMPREHRETGIFDSDLDSVLAQYPDIEIVIGSRTTDGLERLDFPAYELSEIPRVEVERLLRARKAVIAKAHASEIRSILQRPFYFRLFERAAISLVDVRTPADLYGQYVDYLRSRFETVPVPRFDLVAALERQASCALQLGTEAFRLSDFAAILRETGPELDDEAVQSVLNWLVSTDVLIPLGGGRGAFVHQSVTEYLAARSLARRLAADEGDVGALIALRRWDNAIFLAISLLDAERARRVIEQIIAVDPNYAIQAARFVEDKRDELLEWLLRGLLAAPTPIIDRHNADYWLARLPFGPTHEASLRQVFERLPKLRDAAIQALARTLGKRFKPELIDLFLSPKSGRPSHYGMAALGKLLEKGDIAALIDRALEWDPASLDRDTGETFDRVHALAAALQGFPAEDIRSEVFGRLEKVDEPQKRILAALIARIYMSTESTGALDMLVELVRERLLASVFSLYLSVRFRQPVRAHLIGQLDRPLLEVVASYVEAGDRWAVDLLRELCPHSEDAAETIAEIARGKRGSLRQVLEYCATGRQEPLFQWLEEAANCAETVAVPAALKTIDFADLDWSGHHDLLVALLRRREPVVARMILGGSIPVEVIGLDGIDLGDARPWLEWLLELNEAKGDEGKLGWLASQLAFLIARSPAPGNKERLLALLDGGEQRLKWAIGTMVLPHMEGLAIEDFSEGSVAYLLELIHRERYSDFHPHPFAMIATEAFVRDRLLPLATTPDPRLWDNLAVTVDAAGKRLGLRFALPPRPAAQDDRKGAAQPPPGEAG
jgi:hypothetical protein